MDGRRQQTKEVWHERQYVPFAISDGKLQIAIEIPHTEKDILKELKTHSYLHQVEDTHLKLAEGKHIKLPSPPELFLHKNYRTEEHTVQLDCQMFVFGELHNRQGFLQISPPSQFLAPLYMSSYNHENTIEVKKQLHMFGLII
nr:GIDE domain-containing protein [Eisenibacter elegans]